MWVVTCETADTSINLIVAFAYGEAIRLEAHVANTRVRLHSDLGPCPVTLAAEIGCLFGGRILQAGQAGRNSRFAAVSRHRNQVVGNCQVTMFALNSGSHFVER